MRHNVVIGLSRGASLIWGQHAGQRQPTAVPVAQIVQKSALVREKQWKCTHLRQVDTARSLCHVKVTNRAGVPGERIIMDGAWVWMNIATN